ncbi:MAG: hypothetical protein ABIH11_07450 [Candidatus Altiarchaeota archaeon]
MRHLATFLLIVLFAGMLEYLPCDRIPLAYISDSCLWKSAVGSRSLVVCDSIEDKVRMEDCYRTILSLGDESGRMVLKCSRKTAPEDRDDCFMQAGMSIRDRSYCSMISDSDVVDYCVSLFNGNAVYCENLSYRVRSDCYTDYAMLSGNASFCDEISSGRDRHLCLARVLKDKSYCDMIPGESGLTENETAVCRKQLEVARELNVEDVMHEIWVCNRKSPGPYDVCLTRLAEKTDKIVVCGKIADPKVREECYHALGKE